MYDYRHRSLYAYRYDYWHRGQVGTTVVGVLQVASLAPTIEREVR